MGGVEESAVQYPGNPETNADSGSYELGTPQAGVHFRVMSAKDVLDTQATMQHMETTDAGNHRLEYSTFP